MIFRVMKRPSILIFTSLILGASLALAADSGISVSGALKTLVSDQPSLIIVGEDHDNAGLARAVTTLAAALNDERKLNCIFLELPSDSKSELSAAIASDDLNAVATTILKGKLDTTLAAFKKLGYPDSLLEKIKKAWFADPIRVLRNYPIDKGLLELVRKRDITVIPYDSESDAPETYASMYYSVARQNDSSSHELAIGAVESFDVRSKIMGENIRASMKTENCTSAIVVVGYAHLYESKVLNEALGTSFDLSPLQTLLDREGLDSRVLIAEPSMEATEPAIVFGADSRFANFAGKLLSPVSTGK